MSGPAKNPVQSICPKTDTKQCCGSGMFFLSRIRTFSHPLIRIRAFFLIQSLDLTVHKNLKREMKNKTYIFSCYLCRFFKVFIFILFYFFLFRLFMQVSFGILIDTRTIEKRIMKKINDYLTNNMLDLRSGKKFIPDL
jgi:hypothetical protein